MGTIAFNITDSAQKRIVRSMQDLGYIGFRLSIKAGGCSGFQYEFNFIKDDSAKQDSDFQIDAGGASVFIDRASAPLLTDATLTYEEKIGNSEFKILDNPNSQSKCGCGTSFGI